MGALAHVQTECLGSHRSYSLKTINKHTKCLKPCSAHEASLLEMACSNSEGEADLIPLDSRNVKDKHDSSNVKSTKTSKGKEKVPQKSKTMKKQNQSTGAAAITEVDLPNSSGENIGAKKTRNKKSKKSSILSEIKSTASIQAEETNSTISIKNDAKKAARGSAKKGKTDTNGHPVLKSSEEATGHNSSFISKVKPRDQKAWPQLYPPVAKSVVVVESVTKAKVIQGYLGEMYEVLPSYGHVRDLAARSGSVRPDDDYSMVWEVPSPAWSHLKSIKTALSGMDSGVEHAI